MKHLIKPFEDQTFNVAFDPTDLDSAEKAIEIRIPDTFSPKAKKMAEYLKDSSALYLYKNRFVYTDESLNLAGTPDGSGHPCGGPRWVGDSLEALETWMEEGADENDRLGNIPGWNKPQAGQPKKTSELWSVYEKNEGQFTDSYFVRTRAEAECRMKDFIRDNLFELPLETYYGETYLMAASACEHDKFIAQRMEMDGNLEPKGEKLPDVYHLHPLSLIDVCKEAMEAGYHSLYDPTVLVHRNLEEFTEELDPYLDGMDNLYVRFGDVVVRVDGAWQKTTEVYTLV